MASRARITPGDGDPRHGTTNGYSNLRCRCQPCRDAHTAYCLKRRDERSQLDIPEWMHGNYSTYANWMCRCDLCRLANRNRERDRLRG